ncbi:hypothetical protein C7M84_018207 [Penaeus vannamei]|uniref:Uncharacterized protein n=1 Tax=Penaeus vannamei TaxID=6689 RepID=A0A423SI08_PENVA|nr:hypothetical protein C7M84_018207 [Penaeus vannamei]
MLNPQQTFFFPYSHLLIYSHYPLLHSLPLLYFPHLLIFSHYLPLPPPFAIPFFPLFSSTYLLPLLFHSSFIPTFIFPFLYTLLPPILPPFPHIFLPTIPIYLFTSLSSPFPHSSSLSITLSLPLLPPCPHTFLPLFPTPFFPFPHTFSSPYPHYLFTPFLPFPLHPTFIFPFLLSSLPLFPFPIYLFTFPLTPLPSPSIPTSHFLLPVYPLSTIVHSPDSSKSSYSLFRCLNPPIISSLFFHNVLLSLSFSFLPFQFFIPLISSKTSIFPLSFASSPPIIFFSLLPAQTVCPSPHFIQKLPIPSFVCSSPRLSLLSSPTNIRSSLLFPSSFPFEVASIPLIRQNLSYSLFRLPSIPPLSLLLSPQRSPFSLFPPSFPFKLSIPLIIQKLPYSPLSLPQSPHYYFSLLP